MLLLLLIFIRIIVADVVVICRAAACAPFSGSHQWKRILSVTFVEEKRDARSSTQYDNMSRRKEITFSFWCCTKMKCGYTVKKNKKRQQSEVGR